MTQIRGIDAPTLKQWMDKGEVLLIDVRETDEYKEAHIPGALHIPLGECVPGNIPHDPDRHLVFHCKKGKRGGMACEACSGGLPDDEIWNLEGGIDAWIEAGLPVERG